jgi:hypothetical protein
MSETYNEAQATTIVTAVAAGASNQLAAHHVGIPLPDLYAWMDEKPEFAARIDRARADLELLAIGSIRRNVSEDPKAAQWVAERTYGDAELERLRQLTT